MKHKQHHSSLKVALSLSYFFIILFVTRQCTFSFFRLLAFLFHCLLPSHHFPFIYCLSFLVLFRPPEVVCLLCQDIQMRANNNIWWYNYSKNTKILWFLERESPLFCSGIDVGGVEVCTSAKINEINRTFIHILATPLVTPCVLGRGLIVEQLSISSIMSRCHSISRWNVV